MANEYLIYVLVGGLGLLVGVISVFRSYGNKIKDVLLDLKVRGKIDIDEYEYFLHKYVKSEDKTSVLKSVINVFRRKKRDDIEV